MRLATILAIAPLAFGSVDISHTRRRRQDATPAATPALDCSTVEPVDVAFFGFAAADGFAQATWAGVQEAAAEMCATARFFDPNFDSATQVAQIQDAITSGEFEAFVIQSNDGNSVVPVVEEAIEAGIVVVGEFTPIGTDYDSIEPQVEGMTSYVGTSIVANGEGLAELGVDGLREARRRSLPGRLSARVPRPAARQRPTEAVLAGLEAAENVEVVASPEGGYTQATGLAAAQDVLLANPDVDVIIGSSQAILAPASRRGRRATGQVALIGNGAPRQAVAAVKDGRWFAIWADAETSAGKEAASVAIRAARGEEVPSSVDTTKMVPTLFGTAENLPEDFEGQWDA